MKITEMKITVADLVKGYTDDGDGGVFGYNGKLTIRPAYQREFVYKEKQRAAVIDTVRKGYPLNIMYWSKTGDDTFEVLDGQQRTISIAQYFTGVFSIKIDGNDKFVHNLFEAERKQMEDYTLTIYICEGSEKEKLEWFKIVNIAGELLTPQELLNAVYTGSWLADAKSWFSKRNCTAKQMAEGYMTGNPIRQAYLEKVLSWIADRDGYKDGQMYMANHQHDADANDLWIYFQRVISWAKMIFPTKRKDITDSQNWGQLYNKYHTEQYNSNVLESEIQKLLKDEDVSKPAGIIPYVLSKRTKRDEKWLSIRAFSEPQKMRAYEKQGHKCPYCVRNGIDTEYAFEDMEGDHIIPWSQGGHTVEDNLQMLCKTCNREKGNDV